MIDKKTKRLICTLPLKEFDRNAYKRATYRLETVLRNNPRQVIELDLEIQRLRKKAISILF